MFYSRPTSRQHHNLQQRGPYYDTPSTTPGRYDNRPGGTMDWFLQVDEPWRHQSISPPPAAAAGGGNGVSGFKSRRSSSATGAAMSGAKSRRRPWSSFLYGLAVLAVRMVPKPSRRCFVGLAVTVAIVTAVFMLLDGEIHVRLVFDDTLTS